MMKIFTSWSDRNTVEDASVLQDLVELENRAGEEYAPSKIVHAHYFNLWARPKNSSHSLNYGAASAPRISFRVSPPVGGNRYCWVTYGPPCNSHRTAP